MYMKAKIFYDESECVQLKKQGRTEKGEQKMELIELYNCVHKNISKDIGEFLDSMNVLLQ